MGIVSRFSSYLHGHIFFILIAVCDQVPDDSLHPCGSAFRESYDPNIVIFDLHVKDPWGQGDVLGREFQAQLFDFIVASFDGKRAI